MEKRDDEEIFRRVVKSIGALLQVVRPADEPRAWNVSEKTDIFDDLGIDSIEVMDLLGMLEKEFDATFEVDRFGQRRTVGEVVEFISAELKKRGG